MPLPPLDPMVGKRVGKFEESIQNSNTLSFKKDNKHIECVSASLEDQRLVLIEI